LIGRNHGTFGFSAAQLNRFRVDLAVEAKSAFAKALSDGGCEIFTEAAYLLIRKRPG
jgi:hypothetical protein